MEAVAAEALLTPSTPAFDETVMAGPRLHHPYRDYLLLTGPLDAATAWATGQRLTGSSLNHRT